ncbi:MAG: hypothetical protein WB795_17850 [Candidatus Acidiferrales bacterium]
MRWLLPILVGTTLLLPTAAMADELHLKDGSVVTGIVVGYEQDSFRVKTSWGYAEIRKEQVAQIVIGGSTTDASTSATPAAHKSSAAKKSAAPPALITPSIPPPSAPTSSPDSASPAVKGQLLVRAVVSSPNATPVATENSAAAKLAASTPPRPPANAKPPAGSMGASQPSDKLLVNSSNSTGNPASDPRNHSASNPVTKPAKSPATSSARASVSAPGNGSAPAPTPAKPLAPKVSADRTNGTAPPAVPPARAVKPAKLASPSPPAQSSVAAAGSADETASPAPPKRPKAPPAPEPVREAITGNEYTNETYGLRMYRPPDWQLNAAARKLMPGAIAALGTADEKTYFFIGLEPAHGDLAENLAEADKRLRGIMENYHPIGDRQVTISGAPATERRFRGSVDGKDWSGIVAVLPRANQLFTVFGITYADSELAGQIQENVIRRAIDSMAFTPATAAR